jgi:recombinational DNA repair protein (RecF pathway)
VQLAKGRDLLIVTQVETVNAFLPLHDDLVKTGYAAYVVELLAALFVRRGRRKPLYFSVT